MSACTPGPWKAVEDKNEPNFSWIYRDNGTNHWIARIQHNGEAMPERVVADARAMAAAPDMLATLRVIANQSIGSDWTHEEALAFIKKVARAAIIKTQGEPS